jgi:hypothetical protein
LKNCQKINYRRKAIASLSVSIWKICSIVKVQEERRHELFTEHGHRFFDLKRNGALNTVLPIVKLGWNGTDVHWPIPESELLANPNLTQNPG